MKYRVVETDNFGGDYPDESFAGPPLSKEAAERAAEIFNGSTRNDHPRFWKVVEDDYKLRPGFEP